MQNNIILYTTNDGKASVVCSLGKEILCGFGKISNQQMETMVREKCEKFNAKRKKIEAQKADENDIKELEVSYKIVQKSKAVKH